MLMIQMDKSDFNQIQLSDIESILDFDLSKDEEWKVEILKHLLAKQGKGP